jgi:hypothetical protein
LPASRCGPQRYVALRLAISSQVLITGAAMNIAVFGMPLAKDFFVLGFGLSLHDLLYQIS